MSLTAGCHIPFLEVILKKLLFLQLLSVCVSTLPLRALARQQGMQEMRVLGLTCSSAVTALRLDLMLKLSKLRVFSHPATLSWGGLGI